MIMKKTNKGIFISFEGGEGCGKSTHAMLLAKYLTSKGYKVIVTHEPGATRIGKTIREMLLNGKDKLHPYSELFLFLIDRIEHIKHVISPAIKAKKAVISDRFIDSTSAYQIGGRGLPRKLVDDLNTRATLGHEPDKTILLDIPYREGLKRISKRGKRDKFEKEGRSFHERIRREYIRIARADPGRVKMISSVGNIQDVQKKIRIIADKLLRRS